MIRLEDAKIDRFGKIEKITNVAPIFCKENDSMMAASKKILLTNHRRMPVLSKSNKLVGVVTYMDILDAFLRNLGKDSEVSAIMTRDVVFCNADDTISFVLQKLKMSRRGGLPVLKKEKLMGVVGERDFVKFFSDVNFGIKVEELMTPKPLYVSKGLSISDGLKTLVNTRYRRLPVVDKELVGVITGIDLLKYVDEQNYDLPSLNNPIDRIIRTDVCKMSGHEDVSHAIKLMTETDVGGVLIVDNSNKLKGIITERDVLEQIV